MIAAFVDDIYFQARLMDAAHRAGADISFVRQPVPADLYFIDLSQAGAIEFASAVKGRKIAFVSHIDAEAKEKAKAAGCKVMARSEFVQKLGEIIKNKK